MQIVYSLYHFLTLTPGCIANIYEFIDLTEEASEFFEQRRHSTPPLSRSSSDDFEAIQPQWARCHYQLN